MGKNTIFLPHLFLTAWGEHDDSIKISIGDYSSIGAYCHISAFNKISIGNHVLIGNGFRLWIMTMVIPIKNH